MASILKVDKLDPQSATALEIGTSGDTVTVPSGVGLTLTDSTLLLPTTITSTTEVKTNKISPATGVAFALGDSGDTFTVPSGATIVNSGTATGFGGGITEIISHTTLDGTGVASVTQALDWATNTDWLYVQLVYCCEADSSSTSNQLKGYMRDAAGDIVGATDYPRAGYEAYILTNNTSNTLEAWNDGDGAPQIACNDFGCRDDWQTVGTVTLYRPQADNVQAYTVSWTTKTPHGTPYFVQAKGAGFCVDTDVKTGFTLDMTNSANMTDGSVTFIAFKSA